MTQHAELLARYQRLRQVGLALNNRLVETLPRSVLDEGGHKLGLLKGNVLTLDTEDEIAPLMDYCLHDVRRQGLNAIERYLAESPPPPGSDEMVLLEALRQARFTLLIVEAVERGVGVQVRDLLRDELYFLVDIGFSHSAPVGMVSATRVMAPEGIAMTTGAALPVGVLSAADRVQYLEDMKTVLKSADLRQLSPQDSSALAATVMRASLQRGAAEKIRYVAPRSKSGSLRRSRAIRPTGLVGRNDRCPCGSGKKFKHCCGTRR